MKVLALTLAAGIVCAGYHQSLAADKIRLSVTNFNMSFLPAGWAAKRGFFEEGLRAVIDQAVKEGKVMRDIPASEVSDMGPLRDAQRELGIKGR